MDAFNLPHSMANFVDWEYAELKTSEGSQNPSLVETLDITKNGVIPINMDSGQAYYAMPVPLRAGIVVTIVAVRNGGGSFELESPSGTSKFHFQTTSGAAAVYRRWAPQATHVEFITLMSIPAYISGVRTYVWAVIQAAGSSSSWFSAV